MSLVRAKPLSAEVRLAQAISEFEASLPATQKPEFQKLRNRTVQRPPNPQDVYTFTAELDLFVFKNGRSNRAYGTRLMSVLEGIQQFASLGDILIGGSQNLIACGVWSAVRFSLMAIANHSAYINDMTEIFMKIGRSAPRYQNLSSLYPRSKALQRDFAEYYILVVQICHEFIAFLQKSSVQQFFSALSNGMNSKCATLEAGAASIKEEVSLLLAKSVEDEIKNNKQLRKVAFKQENAQILSRNKNEILDSLSTFNHQAIWKRIRRSGTTTVFAQDQEYLKWRSQDKSTTLIFTGNLGSGKSVAMANMVDDLYIHDKKQEGLIASFFCAHDNTESLKSRTIVGSLLRQILQNIPAKEFRKLPSHVSFTDEFEILQHFDILPASVKTRKVLFILDGLDECTESVRRKVVHTLRKLQDGYLRLLLCLGTRLDANGYLNDLAEREETCVMAMPSHNPDLDKYIDTEIERNLSSGKLVLRNPETAEIMLKTLLEASKGMFLWASLQILTLCSMKSDYAIKKALENLPRDLPATYDRILQLNGEDRLDCQTLLLQLTLGSFEPLTLEQLQEAMSVTLGDTQWDAEKLSNDIYSDLDCCGGILIVDEECLTVHYVHKSAQQYLQSDSSLQKGRPLSVPEVNRKMAQICVTYLNYKNLYESSLVDTSRATSPSLDIGTVPAGLISNWLRPSKYVQKRALLWLHSNRTKSYNPEQTVVDVPIREEPMPICRFTFRNYAKRYWPRHSINLSWNDDSSMSLVKRLMANSDAAVHFPEDEKASIIDFVLRNGSHAGFYILLGSNLRTSLLDDLRKILTRRNAELLTPLLKDFPPELKGCLHGTGPLLTEACEKGDALFVKAILAMSSDGLNDQYALGQRPLGIAVANGDTEIVRLLLLEKDILVNGMDENDCTPLMKAIMKNNIDIVKLLLAHDNINIRLMNDELETAMMLAQKYDFLRIQILLQEHDDRTRNKPLMTPGRTTIPDPRTCTHEPVNRPGQLFKLPYED